jgi:hypothetical protein
MRWYGCGRLDEGKLISMNPEKKSNFKTPSQKNHKWLLPVPS